MVKMRKESYMLFLAMILLYWTQTEGGCIGTSVKIYGKNNIPAGKNFNLSCEFTCLEPKHVIQLWRNRRNEEKVSLVNVTYILPNVTVVLSISSAMTEHTGYYSCRTEPPNAKSPDFFVQISDPPVTSTPTTLSTPQLVSTQKHSNAAGLSGQMWFWILLGKTTIFLLSLASLAVEYKRR
ncbi:uncharacterized protein AB9X84_001975 [Acanthopagrus schlegelii]